MSSLPGRGRATPAARGAVHVRQGNLANMIPSYLGDSVKNGAHRSGRDALRGSIVAVGLRNCWGGGRATCGSSGTGKENLVAQRHEEDAGCPVSNVDPQAGRQEFITNEWYERKKHAFFAPLSRPRAGPTCRMLGGPADGENGGGFAIC